MGFISFYAFHFSSHTKTPAVDWNKVEIVKDKCRT